MDYACSCGHDCVWLTQWYILLELQTINAPAREGHMMQILAMVHITRYTPAVASIFACILDVMFLLLGRSVSVLINWYRYSTWLTNGLIMTAVIYKKFSSKWKDKPRAFTASLICPVFMLLVSIFFVPASLVTAPDIGHLYAIILLFLSLLIYFPLVKWEKVVNGTKKVTRILQLALQVAPEEVIDMK